MKKILWSLGCFLLTFLVALFFFAPKNSNNDTQVKAEKQKSYLEEKKSTVFVVSEYQGNIAIFKKGNPSPVKIVDVQLSDLPKQDKELLEKGIEVNSKEELLNILEDYCS